MGKGTSYGKPNDEQSQAASGKTEDRSGDRVERSIIMHDEEYHVAVFVHVYLRTNIPWFSNSHLHDTGTTPVLASMKHDVRLRAAKPCVSVEMLPSNNNLDYLNCHG